MKFKDIGKLAKKLQQGAESSPDLNTGLADEHIIISAYEMMDLKRLIGCRKILNYWIRIKKEELAKKVGYDKYKEIMKEYEK